MLLGRVSSLCLLILYQTPQPFNSTKQHSESTCHIDPIDMYNTCLEDKLVFEDNPEDNFEIGNSSKKNYHVTYFSNLRYDMRAS